MPAGEVFVLGIPPRATRGRRLLLQTLIPPLGERGLENARDHEYGRQEVEDPEVVADVGKRRGHPLETESR
jgi:hypothetical protein